jgi:pilus assembly protein Flp/PilA
MPSTFIRQLVDDQSGATAVEYGLIVSLIFFAIYLTLQGVAGATVDIWKNIETRSSEAIAKT